jgi:hypothetical protein
MERNRATAHRASVARPGSTFELRPRCWNLLCAVPDCDGVHHRDESGGGWEQPRGTQYHPVLGEFVQPCGTQPAAGNAVRLPSPPGALPLGSIGVVNGVLGEVPPGGLAKVTFGCELFRDHVVSGKNGLYVTNVDVSRFIPTSDRVVLTAWKHLAWRPEQESGTFTFSVKVPVWGWHSASHR